MKRVAILDYGSGNLRSAERAFARSGVEVLVTSDSASAIEADGLVVPGVGAFATCMAGIRNVGGEQVIAARLQANRPTLGVCVGMQVLFSTGVEHGVITPGLGIWPGTVDRLSAPRLPHMGWNSVAAPAGTRLFDGIGAELFYFVHSFAVKDWSGASPALVTRAEHGERFVAAVEHGSLSATQFHPEKSGDAGLALIENWVRGL